MTVYSQESCTEFLSRASLDQITKWGLKNPTLVSKYFSPLVNRLYHLKLWATHQDNDPDFCTTEDIQGFVSMLFNRTSFSNTEYYLMNGLTNLVYLPDLNGRDLEGGSISTMNKAILLSFIDSDKIKNGAASCFGKERNIILSRLYQMIIDVYIPTSDPEELIQTILNHVKFDEIIQNDGSTEWIMKKFESTTEVHSTNLKEIIVFCKIVADIYRNEESLMEFMSLLHRMFHKQYWIKGEVEVIVDRFKKYFDDEDGDGYLFVSTLFGLLTDDNVWRGFQKGIPDSDPTKPITNEVDEFLLTYSTKKNAIGLNTDILKIIINEIRQRIDRHDSYNVKRDRVNFVTQKILEGWGSPRYDVDDPERGVGIDTSTPITTLESYTLIALEAVHKDSVAMNSAEKKIYKAYKTYKSAEEKVDSQITKAVMDLKNVATGDVRAEIIEGKKFSAIGLLKRVLGTVGLFAFGPVKACVALVVGYALKKKTTESERRKILMEIDTELEMLEEKIGDAKSDDNREAKYAMMRTKKELENAKTRIMYGMEADQKSLSDTKAVLDNSRRERTV